MWLGYTRVAGILPAIRGRDALDTLDQQPRAIALPCLDPGASLLSAAPDFLQIRLGRRGAGDELADLLTRGVFGTQGAVVHLAGQAALADVALVQWSKRTPLVFRQPTQLMASGASSTLNALDHSAAVLTRRA